MYDSSTDAGVIAVLMERFEKYRLPRVLSMKEKVDRGGILDDIDLAFLKEILTDAVEAKPLIDRHPEFQDLAARMIGLYREITEKAMENEEAI